MSYLTFPFSPVNCTQKNRSVLLNQSSLRFNGGKSPITTKSFDTDDNWARAYTQGISQDTFRLPYSDDKILLAGPQNEIHRRNATFPLQQIGNIWASLTRTNKPPKRKFSEGTEPLPEPLSPTSTKSAPTLTRSRNIKRGKSRSPVDLPTRSAKSAPTTPTRRGKQEADSSPNRFFPFPTLFRLPKTRAEYKAPIYNVELPNQILVVDRNGKQVGVMPDSASDTSTDSSSSSIYLGDEGYHALALAMQQQDSDFRYGDPLYIKEEDLAALQANQSSGNKPGKTSTSNHRFSMSSEDEQSFVDAIRKVDPDFTLGSPSSSSKTKPTPPSPLRHTTQKSGDLRSKVTPALLARYEELRQAATQKTTTALQSEPDKATTTRKNALALLTKRANERAQQEHPLKRESSESIIGG